MKTIKFRPYLIDGVLSGKKTSTWRLFDDKDFQVGDEVELMNWETKEVFTTADIVGVSEKKLSDITDADFVGHESYDSPEALLEEFQKYYGDKATMESVAKRIDFTLI